MRNGSVIVVVLSLVAIAAAVQFFVSTPSAPTASPIDDDRVQPPAAPPAPLLAAAPSTRRCERGARTGSWLASASDCASATDLLEMAQALANPEQQELENRARQNTQALLERWDKDPVTIRIVNEWQRLLRFSDDLAVLYVDLSDEDYRARQFANRQPAPIEGATPAYEHLLPDRERANVDAWLGEPVDFSGSPVPDAIQALATFKIQANRRSAARAYQLEWARLAPDSIREYARNRSGRRLINSKEDMVEFLAAVTAWIERRDSWLAADGHGPDDARELGEIVRTNPRRIWEETPLQTYERLNVITASRTIRIEHAQTGTAK